MSRAGETQSLGSDSGRDHWERMPGEGRVDAKALRQELTWRVRAITKSPTGLEQRKARGWAGRVGPAQR